MNTLLMIFQVTENPVDFLTQFTGWNLLYAALAVVAIWLLVRISNAFLEALSKRAPRARFFFKLLAPMLRFGLWLLGVVILLNIFSPSDQTLLAVLASVGIALGLGAQDLVKNIIGGLVILTDRPYQLGDRVKIGDAYGEIDHIGLRSTKLTTSDDTRVTIPNSDILSGKAWNSNSGVPDCQVVTDLYVPHDTDPTVALEVGYEAAFSSPYLLLDKPVVVLLQDHFQHAPYLVVRVKAYVYDHRFEPRLQSDITMRAKSEFLKRGVLRQWRGYGLSLPGESLNDE
ncbi:MAG: mechanosensitive ion channel family protein [Acidobacteria bacterium]|nr:mechanosensitive ion channel family protein [Acidobacteriota bacterium]